MKKQRRIALSHALAIAALLLLMWAYSGTAYADDNVVAYSTSGNKEYTSYDDAWNAAKNDTEITLASDWVSGQEFTLEKGETATIHMNNHVITHASNYSGNLFVLKSNSTLTLIGAEKDQRTFTFDAYNGSACEEHTITTGGLLSGAKGNNGNKGTAIYVVADDATVNLTNVGIVGHSKNDGTSGAAIQIPENCERNTVNMSNAHIDYNYTTTNSSSQESKDEYGVGGGIFAANLITLTMKKGSTINNNQAFQGGGIYAYSKITLHMEDKSEISGNTSERRGGGLFLFRDGFNIYSEDGTAKISDNVSHARGGAIYTHDAAWDWDVSTRKISGINFSGNNAAGGGGYETGDGGAIYMNKSDTTVQNCTFTKNKAEKYGGAIYNDNDDNSLTNCTIRNNTAGSEGGGVYSDSDDDITLSGKMIIESNHRTDDADDDLFLCEGFWSNAYARGDIEKGSHVGIRNGTSGKRLLVKSLYNYIEGTFFLNEASSYHLGYDNSENELYQYSGGVKYNVTLNGMDVNSNTANSTVVVDGTSNSDDKVFCQWTAAEGYPGSFDSIEDKTNPILTFKMPGNNVNLKASYINRAKSVEVTVARPTVGEKLYSHGKVDWVNNGTHGASVTIRWEKINDDGTRSTVSGVAKAGVQYVASISLEEDASNMQAFDLDLTKDNVQLYYVADSDKGSNEVASASVDKDTGLLSVSGNPVTPSKPTVKSIDAVTITAQEGTTESELKKLLPDTATASTSGNNKVCVITSKDNLNLGSLIQDGKVVKPSDSDKVKLSIPVTSEGAEIPEDTALSVTVQVIDATDTSVALPSVDNTAGRYRDNKLTVKATCETEGSSLYYKIDDGEAQTYTEDGIALSGEKYLQKVVNLQVWAEKDGVSSNVLHQAYLLDDWLVSEKTITIECNGTDATEVVTFQVSEGSSEKNSVEVLAPSIEGKVFDSWTIPDKIDEDDYTTSGNTVTFNDLKDDLTITANYKTTITALDLKIDVPTAGKAMAKKLDGITASVSSSEQEVDVTSFFDIDKITWNPEGTDEKATYDTYYMLRLPVKSTNQAKSYVLSRSLDIKANGKSIGATATATEEGGNYVVYVTFPKTASKPSLTLSTTSYTYNGKAKKPSVTVKANGKTISKDKYSVSYASGRKNVGTYKVTITFKEGYDGEYKTLTKTFKVNPKQTTLKKVQKAKKSFIATWKKQSAQTSGYQIQYSLNKNFKSAKIKTVSGSKKTSTKVKSLKSKKTYYVRIRTYKKVGGTTYCSGWSAKKSVKTK